jgi:hypothetical protein
MQCHFQHESICIWKIWQFFCLFWVLLFRQMHSPQSAKARLLSVAIIWVTMAIAVSAVVYFMPWIQCFSKINSCNISVLQIVSLKYNYIYINSGWSCHSIKSRRRYETSSASGLIVDVGDVSQVMAGNSYETKLMNLFGYINFMTACLSLFSWKTYVTCAGKTVIMLAALFFWEKWKLRKLGEIVETTVYFFKTYFLKTTGGDSCFTKMT